MQYILDTDHISLVQRGHHFVLNNLFQLDEASRFVTIISVAEQVQGRLAVIRRARLEVDAARAFNNLQKTIAFYQSVRVLPYNDKAVALYEEFRKQKIRIGTQDLRIAAIVVSHEATLVTRNKRDFENVPGLSIVDWSL